MSERPLVSIVVTAYNQAAFLGQTLASVWAQTWTPTEVVVVNDGSSDETARVMDEAGDRIVAVHQENAGVSSARNAGLAASRGAFVVFLDGDDLMAPSAIARLVERLSLEPTASWAFCGWAYLDAEGTILQTAPARMRDDLLGDLAWRRLSLVTPGVVILSRGCLERHGAFEASLRGSSEDTDLWLRLAAAGERAVVVEDVLLGYRLTRRGISARITPRHVASRLSTLQRLFARADLPAGLRAGQDEIEAVWHYEMAFEWCRQGDLDEGARHLAEATSLAPQLARDRGWLLKWLGGAALSPTTLDPLEAIRAVVSVAPPGATGLRALGRAAEASYHVASVFQHWEAGRRDLVRRHVWPALRGEPRLARNRGFWSIAAQSMLGPSGGGEGAGRWA